MIQRKVGYVTVRDKYNDDCDFMMRFPEDTITNLLTKVSHARTQTLHGYGTKTRLFTLESWQLIDDVWWMSVLSLARVVYRHLGLFW